MAPTTHRSFCRICVAQCGIEVTVDGERVVSVRGDDAHPVSQGYTCTKGRALPLAHEAPNRMDRPILRVDGTSREVSWDECLDHLGAVLGDVLATSGPESVGVFLGGGGYQDSAGYWATRRFQSRLRSKNSYSDNSLDAVAKFKVAELVFGTVALTPQPDEDTRLLLLFGTNPVVSHGQTTSWPNPVERLRRFMGGGEVWVVDPRSTETARLVGNHLVVRPGTDHAVLGFLVRGVLERADRAEIARRADGVDDLAAAVAPFDRDHAVAVSGADPELLDALLASVLRVGRLAVLTGTGTTMSPGGNLTEWFAAALLAVTGSYDQPGGMWFNPGFINRLDTREVLPGVGELEPGPPSRPDIPRHMGEWPAAVIPDEIEAGRLRVLVSIGANLVTALPDTARVRAALGQLDALVVFDVISNETTDLGTHVLPCTSQLERPDLPSVNDLFALSVFSQYTPAMVPPRGDRRPLWWGIGQVAARAGIDILPAGLDLDTAGDDDIYPLVAKGSDFAALRDADGPVVAGSATFGWAEPRLPRGRYDVAPAVLVDLLARHTEPPSLVLTPRRMTKRMNARAYRDGERAELLLHPDDAAARGVGDGDEVEVRSATGTLRLPARTTDTMRPGAVSVPHGWAEANVNLLISCTDIDPLTGMPLMSGTAVEITKVAPAPA